VAKGDSAAGWHDVLERSRGADQYAAVGELRKPLLYALVQPEAPRLDQRSAATEVITLVIDCIRTIASAGMGRPSSEATPTAATSTSSPLPSSATAP
jgi:hypothetical protein